MIIFSYIRKQMNSVEEKKSPPSFSRGGSNKTRRRRGKGGKVWIRDRRMQNEEKVTTKRKIFKVDKQIVSAAGAIFYFYKDNDINFLAIDRDGNYEALGGKVEWIDKTPQDTVIREVLEESNNLIKVNKEDLKLYFISNKYMLFLCPIKEIKDVSVYGDTEEFTKEKRNLRIYTCEDFIKFNTIKLNKNMLLDFILHLKNTDN